MAEAIRIPAVRILGGRRVELRLTDGRRKEVDLLPLLSGAVFESIRDDDDVFAQARVDPDFGALEWPNGADICPDVLIHDLPAVP